MTPEQVLLYGGGWWLGPLALLLVVGFYLWCDHGPITKRGQEKMRRQNARHAAERQAHAERRAREVSPPRPASERPAQGNVER